jgi:hypothetical protein
MEETPQRHKTTFVIWPHLNLNVRTTRTQKVRKVKWQIYSAWIRDVEKTCNQIIETIFHLQKNCYMFRLLPVAILSEKQYSCIQSICVTSQL